ncbi:hypothetical protein ACGFIK_06190 [Micromonospora sp. NPDC048871]|uniref:hypothetical protein n=1 Tax=unclassified Micromonospora TaxID=2617518 RepID=UPI002E131DC2|nr:hypothetical protein OIE53_04180 [Micromonospora sp. NBC_01739]
MADRIAPVETATRSLFRPVLWLVLIVSAVINASMSIADANVFVGAGFGLVTLTCAVLLVVHHYRNRRD